MKEKSLENKPILAFSYIRFSSQRQERGSSVKRQTDLAEAWAATNNATLNSKDYRDLGVSGFTGAHRSNPDRHGLALFLQGIETGKIPKGSSLLVENLDRLTREHLRAALTLFLRILEAGVDIVSLAPEKVFKSKTNGEEATMDIMIAILELSRGNRESARKSGMAKTKWADAREKATTTGKPTLKPKVDGTVLVGMPGKHPFWIDKTPSGYVFNKNVEAVRYAFKITREGYGVIKARNMMNEKFGLNFSRPYLVNLLKRRNVVGEYQPYESAKKVEVDEPRKADTEPTLKWVRKPIGEPIPNFYPAAITETEYLATQAALAERNNNKNASRTQDRQRVYLFNSLMEDEHGCGFTVGKASIGRGKHKFIPKRALDGKGDYITFPISAFENAMFHALKELKIADVLPNHDSDETTEMLAKIGKRDELKEMLQASADNMKPGKEIAALVKKMGEWQSQIEELEREITTLQQRKASPQVEAWKEMSEAVNIEDPDTRTRVRNAFRRLVSKMVCIFHGEGRYRCALVQVFFKSGGPQIKDKEAKRIVCIYYRAATNTFHGLRDEELVSDTWVELPATLNDPAEVRKHMSDFVNEREDARTPQGQLDRLLGRKPRCRRIRSKRKAK